MLVYVHFEQIFLRGQFDNKVWNHCYLEQNEFPMFNVIFFTRNLSDIQWKSNYFIPRPHLHAHAVLLKTTLILLSCIFYVLQITGANIFGFGDTNATVSSLSGRNMNITTTRNQSHHHLPDLQNHFMLRIKETLESDDVKTDLWKFAARKVIIGSSFLLSIMSLRFLFGLK